MNRRLPDHIEEILHQAAKQGVQVRLASPDKVRLVGPPKAVEALTPLVLEHKPLLLERLQRDPWAWHITPTDSADKDALEWWSSIEHLREILAYEDWSLARVGKWLVVVAEPYFTPEKLQRLNVAVSGLRACGPVLVSKVEFFPELTPSQARGLLDRIEECHGKEGFRVLGWHGLEIPRAWPMAIWTMLYTSYTQSLQTEGMPQ
jgi:hypothetical protein